MFHYGYNMMYSALPFTTLHKILQWHSSVGDSGLSTEAYNQSSQDGTFSAWELNGKQHQQVSK